MSTNDKAQLPEGPLPAGPQASMGLLKKLGIWCLFLAVLYLARDFFFTAFMTFIFCYLTLAVVDFVMKRLSPGKERLRLRSLVTVAVFVLVPMILLGVGTLLAPRLIAQGHRLGGWLSQMSPETEAARLLENFVGPSEFKSEYGNSSDPRYQKALAEFREKGETHVEAYNTFPQLEAWREGSFSKSRHPGGERPNPLPAHARGDVEQGARALVPDREGTPAPGGVLQRGPRRKVGLLSAVPPLVRAAASSTPEQLLQQARHDPGELAHLRTEWIDDTLEKDLAAARKSPGFKEQLRRHYEQQRDKSPQSIPYTFEEYLELQKVRPQGRRAFGDALEKIRPTAAPDAEARLRSDVAAAKTHELFSSTGGAPVRRRCSSSSSSRNTSAAATGKVGSRRSLPL